MCGQALVGMTTKVGYTADGGRLGGRLRSVAQELDRVAALLEGETSDTIGFFNEEARTHGAKYLGDQQRRA